MEIPYIKGLFGYSDGDALLHAIADAILGAMASGDIGLHFPDTDPRYKGIQSKEIVRKVLEMMRAKKYILKNIDAVILAEEPKIAPFREKMLDRLSSILETSRDNVNIKATTNEGVGSIGRGEAIAAYAVVLLESGGKTL